MRQSNNINPNTNNDFITDMNGNPVKRIKVRLVSREEYERIMKERENK